MTTSGTQVAATCPRCGNAASGHFCANCGAPLAGARCASCAAALTPGARFCHRCGTAVGSTASARPESGFSGALPWAVAGIALVALIALVAGQRFHGRASAESADAAPPAIAGAAADGGAGPVRAPDISQLTPRERADRLYDRIMRLDGEGKKDSVQFFAQMAIAAYQELPDQDADSRYDMGRIAEAAGAAPLARVEADSILAAHPTHLLGLTLAMRTATQSGDSAGAARFARRLLAAASAERRKNLPEYERHARDLDDALDQAARLTGRGAH